MDPKRADVLNVYNNVYMHLDELVLGLIESLTTSGVLELTHSAGACMRIAR